MAGRVEFEDRPGSEGAAPGSAPATPDWSKIRRSHEDRASPTEAGPSNIPQFTPLPLLGLADTEPRTAQAHLVGLLEIAEDAIISVDETQRIVLFNRGAEKIFGYAAPEVLGRTLDCLLPSAARDRHRQHVAEFGRSATRSKVMSSRSRIAGLRKDRTEFAAEASISKVISDGKTIYTVILRDITERLRMERELRNRAEELARSNSELERFAYVASHDLQEPLRMVSSYTQLLGKRYQGRLDRDADEFIAFAVDGVKRMQDLINDLLAYSRVGTKGRACEQVACHDILTGALGNLEAAIAESRAAITHDPLPTVTGDPTLLRQLVQNLLGNAIKFRSDAPVQIHVGVKEEPHQWIISVRDNGIGIEPQYAEKVFAVFQRLHGQGKYPGTGIGLAICRKIVDYHGGKIWVESSLGRGATFLFTLPKRSSVSPQGG